MTVIVHIIDEMKIGGAQTHLITMLRYLQKNYNFKHIVIGLFGEGPIADILRELEIDVIVLDVRDDLGQRRFDRAVNTIRKVLIDLQPDLVEAHLTWSRLLGLLAARLAGIKRRIGYEQGDIYLKSIKFRVANFISQVYTERYIVCSHALLDWVNQTHHISKNKITVLHNCVDLEKFNQDVKPTDDILRFKTPDNTLLAMVGTLGDGVNKRVDIGIRATAIARQQGGNIHLIIAGDGNQRSTLEDLAKELGIEDYVHFLGMRSDIPHILRSCDVFCHTAPFEPFGIVAIEAMATGLPAIVPNSGGIQEAVQHNVTGLIYSVLEAEKLADAIIQLSQNRIERERMGKNASQSIVVNFSVKQYIEQLYTLYGLII